MSSSSSSLPSYMTPRYSSSLFTSDEECLLYPSPLKFKGIPFSWEQIPGIPKHVQESKNNNKKQQQQFHHHHHRLLPPPPASKLKSVHGSTCSSSSSSIRSLLQRDPFIAALVECSKEGDCVGGSRRMSGHRLGFINMVVYGTSCKRSAAAAVSDSIVCFSRSTPQ